MVSHSWHFELMLGNELAYQTNNRECVIIIGNNCSEGQVIVGWVSINKEQ